jgi:magnesium transporter
LSLQKIKSSVLKKRKTGIAPGTVLFTGHRKVEHVNIHYIEFNEDFFHHENKSNTKLESLYEPHDGVIQWYDIRGLHDIELIEQLGHIFGIHPMALEEIADVHQRPKYEEYASGIFIVLNSLSSENQTLNKEYLTIYFGEGYVLSFQEEETDVFKPIRERLKSKLGRIRNKGADYLAYAMIDLIIDHYFILADSYSEEIDLKEDEILSDPKENHKSGIHNLKSDLLQMKRNIFPLREAISRFSKSDHKLIDESNLIFIRDAYENIVQVIELIENNRDIIYSLHDLYNSEISFKMNRVINLLTIITTIFVPLSFLAGVYGMNFQYMPELTWKYGYFILLGIMISISLIALIIFKRKNWL